MSSIEDFLTGPGGFAERMRQLRRDANLTGAALAERLGWGPAGQPRISRVENGRYLPSEEEIKAWVTATGGTDDVVAALLDLRVNAEAGHRRWKLLVRGGQAALQEEYDRLFREATVIRNQETLVVPGLLQTRDYALGQAMHGVELHGADAGEVPATVDARLRRQDILWDTSKRFEFLIAEAALWHPYCPLAAMRDQLDRLATMTYGRSNVWLGILPFGVPLRLVLSSGFVIVDGDVAIVETSAEEHEYRGSALASLDRMMSTLAEQAVTGEDARRLLVRAMDAIGNGGSPR